MPGKRRARIAACVGAIAALTATQLGWTAPAASSSVAGVDPSAYQGVYVGFSAQNARAGGYLRCPAGRKAAAGGAYLSSADGALTSLAPTADGNGWFVSSSLNSSTGAELTAFGFCVPAAQVAAVTTIVVSDHRDRVDFHQQRSCPAGELALSGGGFLHRSGQDPDPADPAGGYGLFSRPTADGTGWEHAVSHTGVYGHRDHTFILRCLPAAALPGAVGVTADIAIPARRNRGLVPVPVAGVARCPAGTSVYAGGGVFTKANGEVIGGLSTSAPTFAGTGWQVTGIGPGGGTLSVVARCVANPIVFTPDGKTTHPTIDAQHRVMPFPRPGN